MPPRAPKHKLCRAISAAIFSTLFENIEKFLDKNQEKIVSWRVLNFSAAVNWHLSPRRCSPSLVFPEILSDLSDAIFMQKLRVS